MRSSHSNGLRNDDTDEMGMMGEAFALHCIEQSVKLCIQTNYARLCTVCSLTADSAQHLGAMCVSCLKKKKKGAKRRQEETEMIFFS